MNKEGPLVLKMGRGWFGGRLEALYELGLENVNILLPEKKSEKRRLGELIENSVVSSGNLVVISGTCPDYSHHFDIGSGKEIYDFQGLGEEAGLNTETLLTGGQPFVNALRTIGVKEVRYVMGYADVEADDDEILGSVNLDREGFLARVQNSIRRTQLIGSDYYGESLKVVNMSQLLLPEDYKRAEVTMSIIKDSALKDVAQSRRNLYSRWFHGFIESKKSVRGYEDELYNRRAKEDIRKYLTFGFAARRMGAVILEATAPKITRLYNFGDGYSRELGLKALPPSPVVVIEEEH